MLHLKYAIIIIDTEFSVMKGIVSNSLAYNRGLLCYICSPYIRVDGQNAFWKGLVLSSAAEVFIYDILPRQLYKFSRSWLRALFIFRGP